MAGPWEKYQAQSQSDTAPWLKYQKQSPVEQNLAPQAIAKPWEKYAQKESTSETPTGYFARVGGDIKDVFKENLAATKEGGKQLLGSMSQPSPEQMNEDVVRGGAKAVGGIGGMITSPAEGVLRERAKKILLNPDSTPEQKEAANRIASNVTNVAALGLGAKLPKGGTIAAASNPEKEATVIEKIFSPTTVDKTAGKTEGTIRENIGQAERETSITKANLDQYQKQINSLPQDQKLAFIDYVEGRGKGASLSDKTLQPVADSLKNAFESRRTKLESMPSTEKAGFVEDYFPHLWKDPKQAQAFIGGFGKQGSGKNLKARSIPTIADGIKAGLVPAFDNPLDAAMQYTANMDRYIANNQIFQTLKDNGSAKYFAPGQQPAGWVELKGRLAEKAIPMAENQAMIKKAYAPESAARVYNNYISRGFADIGPEYGQLYEGTQKVMNSVTAAELGLSAFHASTMAMESMISGVANGVGLLAKGKPLAAAGQTVKSIGPWKPVLNYMKGKKFEQQYLGTRDHGPDFRNIVDLGTKAGMRAVGKDKSMRASSMGSFWDSWKKGTLKTEALADMKQMKGSPGLGTAKVFAKNVGRIMDTVAQPLFEKAIPRLKNGAFYETMETWIKTHPGSSKEEQMAAARQVWDSVDNRFGELVQDNLFWNKMLKQSLQLMVRSTGWDLGTLREIGGGAKDLVKTITKGKELSPRTQYLIALPIVTGLYNAAAQYIKTGKSPEKMEDLYAYQTGGTNPDGTPERAMIPGYMKDVLGYAHNPLDEAEGKIGSGPKDAWGLMTNQDFQSPPNFYGQRYPIAKDSTIPGFVKGYAKFIADAYTPISIKNAEKGSKVGSNIGKVEKGLAVRPAPFFIQNPEKAKQLEEIKKRKLEQGKQRYNQKQEAIYGGPQ